MITNFEKITKELSQEELELLPILIIGFKSHSINNPIKAQTIIEKMNLYLIQYHYKIRMNGPRLRKFCNHIRTNAIIPLIATSNGYFVSHDLEILKSQIRSLYERAKSIQNCAEGLTQFISP